MLFSLIGNKPSWFLACAILSLFIACGFVTDGECPGSAKCPDPPLKRYLFEYHNSLTDSVTLSFRAKPGSTIASSRVKLLPLAPGDTKNFGSNSYEKEPFWFAESASPQTSGDTVMIRFHMEPSLCLIATDSLDGGSALNWEGRKDFRNPESYVLQDSSITHAEDTVLTFRYDIDSVDLAKARECP